MGGTRRSPGVATASGSLSMARRQIALLPDGSPSRRQSLQEVGPANPLLEVDPAILASFTCMDSESEISADDNPARFVTVENRSTVNFRANPAFCQLRRELCQMFWRRAVKILIKKHNNDKSTDLCVNEA